MRVCVEDVLKWLSAWLVQHISLGFYSNSKTQTDEWEDQIIIITYKDKQLVTSLFPTPSLLPPSTLLTFIPSVLPHPASSISPPLIFPCTSSCSSLLGLHWMNSDHVWHFIGSLHISSLLRLMGCLAINEHAKTWTGPQSSKDTHTWTFTRIISISSRMPELGPQRGALFLLHGRVHTQKIYT